MDAVPTGQIAGELNTCFARHHYVEDHQVKLKPCQIVSCLCRVGSGRDTMATLTQKTAQQIAQPVIIIDDNDPSDADDYHRSCDGAPAL